MKKNPLFTFVCACFPGFGQMYYGYMRRGTSLALWFWGLVFFAGFSGLGMLGVLLPVIWAYSFFDTFNIRSLSPEQYAAFGDDYIPSREWAQQVHLDRFLGGGKKKILGWVLIIFGCLIIYNTLFSNLLWRLYDYIPFLAFFIEAIPPLFIAGVVILLGLYVLRGKKPGFMNRREDDYYGDWQNGQTPPPPPSYDTHTGQQNSWDPRANTGPEAPWDYSDHSASQPQGAKTEPAYEQAAAAAPSPEAGTPAEEPAVAVVEEEIVLTFDESAPVQDNVDDAESDATAGADEADKPEGEAAESAENPEENKEENETEKKTTRGKKEKKKEDKSDA
ncbi:hypothetical protein LJC49_08335 [Ruminococcaceae bacterium OttesenSCG-928-I18]|nr:hypothetical protein [Ruminococcaceae bacterium OttesenSCG-928-I18]